MGKYERAIDYLYAADNNVAVIKNCYKPTTLSRVRMENTMSLRDLYTVDATSRSDTSAYKMDFTLKNKQIEPLSTSIKKIKEALQQKYNDKTLAVDYHLMITGPNQNPGNPEDDTNKGDGQRMHADAPDTDIYYTAIIPLNIVVDTGTEFGPDAKIKSFDQYDKDKDITERVINEYRAITIFGGKVLHSGLANIDNKKRYFVFAVFRDEKIKDANASEEALIEQEIAFAIEGIIEPIDIFNDTFKEKKEKCNELLKKKKIESISDELKKLFKSYFDDEKNKDKITKYVTDSVTNMYKKKFTAISVAPVVELEYLIEEIEYMIEEEEEEEDGEDGEDGETKEQYRLRF